MAQSRCNERLSKPENEYLLKRSLQFAECATYANGVALPATITVAETGPFQKKIAGLLTEQERADLVSYLAQHPNAGVILRDAGGIGKLRWARQGGGKSGASG